MEFQALLWMFLGYSRKLKRGVKLALSQASEVALPIGVLCDSVFGEGEPGGFRGGLKLGLPVRFGSSWDLGRTLEV